MSCLGSKFRRGAGVLDIVYESPFQLLTCGYDTFIRYWDLRVCSRYMEYQGRKKKQFLVSLPSVTLIATDKNH